MIDRMAKSTRADGVLCDFRANSGRAHLQFLLVLFRLSQKCRLSQSAIRRTAGLVVTMTYRCYGLFVCGVDVPSRTTIGPGLRIHHGFGLVVSADCVIGSNVTLRHNTTLGSKGGQNESPVLGDDVSVGPNCCIVGPYVIGARTVVGAGAVVTDNVPSDSVVAGNPARLLSSASKSSP